MQPSESHTTQKLDAAQFFNYIRHTIPEETRKDPNKGMACFDNACQTLQSHGPYLPADFQLAVTAALFKTIYDNFLVTRDAFVPQSEGSLYKHLKAQTNIDDGSKVHLKQHMNSDDSWMIVNDKQLHKASLSEEGNRRVESLWDGTLRASFDTKCSTNARSHFLSTVAPYEDARLDTLRSSLPQETWLNANAGAIERAALLGATLSVLNTSGPLPHVLSEGTRGAVAGGFAAGSTGGLAHAVRHNPTFRAQSLARAYSTADGILQEHLIRDSNSPMPPDWESLQFEMPQDMPEQLQPERIHANRRLTARYGRNLRDSEQLNVRGSSSSAISDSQHDGTLRRRFKGSNTNSGANFR